MANENLSAAKKAKNDEFYTQFVDIEKEMNAYLDYDEDVFRDKVVLLPCDDPEWSNFTRYFAQNFERLGLKKLISTSYAPNSKPKSDFLNPTLFELEDPQYDEVKSFENGKIFILERDVNGDNKINVEDLQWNYLDCDGDFRSTEITALRDQADIIVTNPPFSLFREFLGWIVEGDKHFIILGNMNALTYKEVFPLIQTDKIWTGTKRFGGGMDMLMPRESFDPKMSKTFEIRETGEIIKNIMGVIWFTNIDHGRRHLPIPLMTQQENIRFSKHKEIKDAGYRGYDNYSAIEVPFIDAIPSDFEGVMGVPITFIGQYNPEQFEIVGTTESNAPDNPFRTRVYDSSECREAYLQLFGKAGVYDLNASGVINGTKVYKRILIRHRKSGK